MSQMQIAGSDGSIDLRHALAIIRRRRGTILIVMAVSLGAAVWISKRMQPRWQASAQMILIQRAAMTIPSTEEAFSSPMLETPETQAAMLVSDGMAQRTLEVLKEDALAKGRSTDSIGIADAETFRQRFPRLIKVSLPKSTNLLEVTAEADSRSRSLALANAVCRAFIAWKDEIAQKNVQDAARNLEVRARRAREQLQEAERVETAFKQAHNRVNIPEEEKAAVDQYLQRDAEVKLLQQDLVSQEARLKALGERLQTVDAAIKNGTGVRDDALVLSLQVQLKQLEIERAELAQKVTPEFPGGGGMQSLPQLDSKIQEVKDQLAKVVQGTLDEKRPSLQAQGALFEDYKQTQITVLFTRSKLAAAIVHRDELQREKEALPRTGMQYARLSRDVDMARALYTALQSALNSARTDADRASGNVQITQAAIVPILPSSPSLTKNLLAGALVGVVLAVGLVLLFEHMDNSVHDTEDVRRLVPGPIIGTVPKISRAQMGQLLRGEIPPIAASFYGLARANLSLAVREQGEGALWGHQVILVTSALPGEGKSTTAATLARSIARTDARVVLVDADMRRPVQKYFFKANGPQGLADVLAGAISLERAMIPTDTKNLFVLHSGTPLRDPAELVSLPRMERLLAALRKQADVVILDAPASAMVPDALLMASHVDCILCVISAGQSDSKTVQETIAGLSAAAPKKMVFFINRAPVGRSRAYRDYYYSASKNGPTNGHAYPASNGHSGAPGHAVPVNMLRDNSHDSGTA